MNIGCARSITRPAGTDSTRDTGDYENIILDDVHEDGTYKWWWREASGVDRTKATETKVREAGIYNDLPLLGRVQVGAYTVTTTTSDKTDKSKTFSDVEDVTWVNPDAVFPGYGEPDEWLTNIRVDQRTEYDLDHRVTTTRNGLYATGVGKFETAPVQQQDSNWHAVTAVDDVTLVTDLWVQQASDIDPALYKSIAEFSIKDAWYGHRGEHLEFTANAGGADGRAYDDDQVTFTTTFDDPQTDPVQPGEGVHNVVQLPIGSYEFAEQTANNGTVETEVIRWEVEGDVNGDGVFDINDYQPWLYSPDGSSSTFDTLTDQLGLQVAEDTSPEKRSALEDIVAGAPAGYWKRYEGLYQYTDPETLNNPLIDQHYDDLSPETEDPMTAVWVIGGTMVPGVGETLDGAVLGDPNSSNFDRKLATLSLGISAWTAGYSPNFGFWGRGSRWGADAGDLGSAANAANRVEDFAQPVVAPRKVVPTGQIHHPISTKVGRALEKHDTLAGHYKPRDPRFTTQAVDDAAHRGYQRWHRQLDDEVVKWLDENPAATPQQFESYLRGRYSQPDLADKFPNGF